MALAGEFLLHSCRSEYNCMMGAKCLTCDWAKITYPVLIHTCTRTSKLFQPFILIFFSCCVHEISNDFLWVSLQTKTFAIRQPDTEETQPSVMTLILG